MRKLVFLFTATVFLVLSLAAQKTAKEKTDKAVLFDQYIRTAYPTWKTTGMAMAVVKDGKVIFKNGYGVTDSRTNQPFTTSTIAFCASTTKAMTSACIAMLVDEGKLKWNDKLKHVLPQFRLYDAYVNDEITVKDLLIHNAGLGNGDLLWLFGYSSEEIMYRMRYMKPAYPYHASFIYQNLMYVVAGELIKKVSGIPWNEFIAKRIFQPLGMNHTYTMFTLSAQEPSRMTPHFMYEDSVVKPIDAIDFGGYDPAGSVVSTIDDITKWMQFLQDSAQLNGKRLITAASFAELFKPQSFVTSEEFYPTQAKTNPHWTTYGLGWFQQDYRGKMIQFHTGSLDGAIAIFGSVPEEKLSFYFFGNLDHSEIRHALMWKAIDLWSFNDNSRDWSTELYTHYRDLKVAGQKAEKEKESKRVLNTNPSLPLEAYAGTYTNEIYGDAAINLANGVLTVKFPNNISLVLQHWNYNTFRGTYNYDWYGKANFTFALSDEGKVTGFDFDGIVYSKKVQ